MCIAHNFGTFFSCGVETSFFLMIFVNGMPLVFKKIKVASLIIDFSSACFAI